MLQMLTLKTINKTHKAFFIQFNVVQISNTSYFTFKYDRPIEILVLSFLDAFFVLL